MVTRAAEPEIQQRDVGGHNWEAELRTSLRLSLEPDCAELPVLRRGHAIALIEDALASAHRGYLYVDTHLGVR